MDLFKWSSEFEIGLKQVDEQHHKLVDITNSLGNLLSNDSVKNDSLERVFDELVEYTQYHFSEEENMMSEFGIDQRHLHEHIAIHTNFLKDVLDFKEDFNEQNLQTSKSLFDYLMNWLVYHILGEDMSMSRQIAAIKNGKSPSEAYDIENKREERSTTMLLTSLNNLFEQISKKNKILRELNHDLEEKVKERTKELSNANEQLHKLATTDTLTGLANRRKAMYELNKFWNEANGENVSLSCIMIDADNFKQINDTCGHYAGDEVLKRLSRTILYAVRTDDVVCRLGGDEFFVICPLTDEEGVLKVAKQIHKDVSGLHVKVEKGIWEGSISLGIATKTKTMKSIDELIKTADLAVYKAKESGKNCVGVF